MAKCPIHQEDITVLNLYTPTPFVYHLFKLALKFIKKKMRELQGEMNKLIIDGEGF